MRITIFLRILEYELSYYLIALSVYKFYKRFNLEFMMFHVGKIYIPLDFRPSTFAQAAKLRRVAAAKEKELTKSMLFLNT